MEQDLPFSVVSLVEDVLQQQLTRSSHVDSAPRKGDEASLRRYEAAGWLRKMIGVVGGKDLPAEPSEEEFRLGLRSGIILCNVVNKVQPGAVPKVVEGACDSVVVPDGAALSAFQYFENVRNFLVAVEELGIPSFEYIDFEEGGKSSRIINCVLALKSFSDWKQNGGTGTWKYGGNSKAPFCGTGKPFFRKISEPFMNSFSRTSSNADQSLSDDPAHDPNETDGSRPMSKLVRTVLSNRKQEEIPNVVENMLNKLTEEFERRLASQKELMKAAAKDVPASSYRKRYELVSDSDTPRSRTSSDKLVEEETSELITSEVIQNQNGDHDELSEDQGLKQPVLVRQQQVDSQVEEETYGGIKFQNQNGKQLEAQDLKPLVLVRKQQRDVQKLKETLQITKEGMRFLQRKYQEEFLILGKHFKTLAHAASGYQRVLEENRKLYNQLQDLKGNIRVYCRVRPFLTGQQNRFGSVDSIEEGKITIVTPSKYGKEGRKTFTFNKVFGPFSTQAEVFSDTQPLIRSVLDGYNVCIFAYGQTGSGKTFTMSGPDVLTEETLGVNYRALSDLFFLSDQRKEVICYDISVQMLEIYNEQVRDLIATDCGNKRLEIRNSSQNGINVPDASLVQVSSTSDVINLMNIGQKNRAVGSTAMNDRSSRSHSCLTVHVQGRELASGSLIRGSMHLVDLAGSERADKTEATGDRLKEAQHINKSLSALGDVIASLAQKGSHVPYRNSKLTQLLQDSLGGQAKTLMFVHISPEPDATGETISTLKFAERVATVELGAARVNKDNGEVKELKEQIAGLKAALARKEEGDSRSSTPERSSSSIGMKSGMNSPSQYSWSGASDMSNGQEEVKSNTSTIPRRRSLDPRDLRMNSPSWPPVASPALNEKEDDKESVSGDWVDKVMVNRHEMAASGADQNPAGQWQVDSRLNNRDPSKIYPEQPHLKPPTSIKSSQENDSRRSRYDLASTDDYDETGTSDCSEPDLLYQSNLPRVSSLPTLTKPKKNNPKKSKGTDQPKSMIPSLIPSPARKQPNGVTPAAQKLKKVVSVDGKKRIGHAK